MPNFPAKHFGNAVLIEPFLIIGINFFSFLWDKSSSEIICPS